jgi:hypothetical protein
MKLIKTLFLLILIFLQLPACKKDKDNQPSAPPDPIAAYDFVGNANNSISQLHDGIKVGAINNSLDSFGTPNAAFFFPGDSFVQIPDSDILDFGGNQFTITIKKQVWQHLAVTFSGKELVIYYNGEKEGTTAVDRPLKISASPLNIGANQAVLPAGSFEGTIDNVRIFDKALDAGQVKNLYQNYRLYEK